MKHKRSFLLTLGITGALLLLVVVGLVLAASVTIDTFNNGELYVQTSTASGSSASGYEDCTGCLAGQRDAYAQKLNTGGRVDISVDQGRASFNQASGAQGWGRIVWDGKDNDGTIIDKDGLGGEDLTNGGTNDGFQILVYNFDAGSGGKFRMGIWVYTNTQTAYYTLTLNAAVSPPGESFFIPFLSFAGDDIFDIAGAVEFRFAPDVDVDLTVDLFEATANTDWGDLPENGTSVNGVARYYTTTNTYNGPRHVKGDLYLGGTVDLEADGFPTNDATGDQNNLDDEDGIERVTLDDGGSAWEGGTGHISATVTGGTGDLYGWFDWNNDGDFDDANETQSWATLSAGEHRLAITVDNAFEADNDLFARFRLVENGASAPDYTGEVTNGEVEDYYWWDWGPNAVTLSSVEASSSFAAPVALVALGLVGALGVVVLSRRRKA